MGMLRSPRAVGNFLDGWQEFTEDLPASEFLRFWAGLYAISGALTRRTWLVTKPGFPPLSPNLFLLLVGAPGTGKDIAMGTTRKLWREAMFDMPPELGINVGPKSLTAKGILDALVHDRATLKMGPRSGNGKDEFHSIVLVTPELGTLLPEYDPRLVSNLCDLYNCDDIFDEQTRNGKGEPLEIEFPHLAMLSGTQPSFLASNFPDEAYGMGFFSRTILLFEPVAQPKDFYFEDDDLVEEALTRNKSLLSKLSSDLRAIMQLRGRFKPDLDFKRATNNFIHELGPETQVPGHRFKDYNTRRSLHLQKIAMCYSAAQGGSLKLTQSHWDKALECLLYAEKRMPQIFLGLATNRGFHNTVEEVLQLKGPFITHSKLVRLLRQRHPPQEVGQVLNSMLEGGEIKKIREEKGYPVYQKVKANSKPSKPTSPTSTKEGESKK